jgi:uncharacterized membrane protein YuzA (DUF378 family)
MNKFDQIQIHTKLRMLALALIVSGGLNWGLVATMNVNLVDKMGKLLSSFLKLNDNISVSITKVVYLLIALSAIYIAINRDNWLPFLGDSVLPPSVVPLKEPTVTDMTIDVKVTPNSKVIYWAANRTDKIQDVLKAYGNFENSGVVVSDNNGIAKLKLTKGSGYKVPSGKYIPPHVHYRVIEPSSGGIIGKVMTKMY